MRKIAMLAMLAIVAAMVPMTASVAAGTGTIHIINGTSSSRDFWVGDQKAAGNLGPGQGADFTTEIGNYVIKACDVNDAAEAACVPTPSASSPFALESGQHKTASLNPLGVWLVATDDTEPTHEGDGRWTIHNNMTSIPGGPYTITACLDGEVIIQVGPGQSDDADFEVPQDAPVPKLFVLPTGAFTNCSGAGGNDAPYPFATGLNFITTFNGSEACATDGCLDGVLVGEKPGDTSQQVAEFCALLPQLESIQGILDDLFLDVVPGDLDTYPSVEDVENGWEEIKDLLDAIDEVVPDAIAETYYEATQELRELLTGLQARFFDLANFTVDQVRDLQQGLEEPAGPTPEDEAREQILTDYFITNCAGAVETEPTFTG